MDLIKLLETLENSPLGRLIAEDAVLFPAIETIHVLAIVAVVGTISIVDLRLLGVRAHTDDVRALLRQMLPFTWTAFVIAAISGALLFISKATVYAENLPFQLKLVALAIAALNMIFFHLFAKRSVVALGPTLITPLAAGIAGAVSLCLWMTIVVLGRWIAFAPHEF